MAEISCQFVRPDRLIYEGKVDHMILSTYGGELGIWPGHSPQICALGDGLVRLHLLEEDGGGEVDVVVSGGYAEVEDDQVIVLADHARRTDDIEADTVLQTRGAAIDKRDELPPNDPRRAYYENKIKWCNLLLKQTSGV